MKLKRPHAPPGLPKLIVILAAVLLIVSSVSSVFFKVRAAQLTARSLEISASTINATNVSYIFSFTLATAGTLGSIVMELCVNDPFPETPCTPPLGLDMSSAVLASQNGEVGFSIDSGSTANKIVLTRAPSAALAQPVSYTFNGIINPSVVSTYYGRLITYATNDASGSSTDKAGLAWATTNQFSLNTEVPQFLQFCSGVTINAFDCSSAAGSNIDFGNLSPASTSAATSQFVAAGNAGYGFNISVYGLTMTSGTHTIPPLTTQTFTAPGNSQFGFNARANSAPAIGTDPLGPGIANVDPAYDTADQYRFNNGDLVVASSGSSDYRKFTMTYITNVSSSQSAGHYGTTLTYVCLANF